MSARSLTGLRKALHQFHDRFSWRQSLTGLTILLFAAAGALALYAVNADTLTQAAEAEDGIIAGNAEKKDAQTGASGGTVSFGTKPNTGVLPFRSKTTPFPNPPSGFCLDVQDGVASPSTPIRIWNCNNAPAQQWTVQFTKNGTSEIRALGQCLTADNSISSSPTYIYTYAFLSPCNGSREQLWLPYADNTQVRSYLGTFIGARGYCLDIVDSGLALGTRVGLWECLADPSQNWGLPDDAPYAFVGTDHYAADTGKCLDLPSGNTAAGTQLQIWDCNGEQPQYIVHGYEHVPPEYRVRISVMDRCFETKDGGVADGTPVQINTCSDSAAQDWQRFHIVDGQTWSFKHRISGKCLDTTDGQVANSAKIVIRTCDANSPGQVFGES